ncbi:MAG: imidazoleglycerol-phosphate dehydratase HisB [Armatimonadetes bacterium]|nr:imidazoleglycerol-phosphate dehydratase HisB [Candidatus Hippobium faecium]
MRKAEIIRKTKETDIGIKIDLDGSGKYNINSGIGFFDHMLSALSRHSLIDIDIYCKGDLEVDGHHTVEDIGIALGQAFRQAIGDKKGICRYGFFILPMDEACVECALDFSGRGVLVYNIPTESGMVGDYDISLTEEFMRAFAMTGGINIYFGYKSGKNSHHIIEATFKALAKSLRMAVSFDAKDDSIPSTKGMI